MAKSLGIVNDMLDEALRNELRRYKPKNIHVDMTYLPQVGKYAVGIGIDKRRRFLSFYEGRNPQGFLTTQELRLNEMFACNVDVYLDEEGIEWTR